MQKRFLNKVHCPFMLKAPKNQGICESYLNIIKTIYNKPTASILLNREKHKAFTLNFGLRKGCPFFPFLFSTVFEVSP